VSIYYTASSYKILIVSKPLIVPNSIKNASVSLYPSGTSLSVI
jgi:hypothetical protein